MRDWQAALAAGLFAALFAAPGCGARDAVTETASAPASAATFDALDEAMASGAFPKTTSVVIVDRGETVFEKYYGGGGPEILNNTRSATKSVSALAIGAALADGAISSVDASAFDYLVDLSPFANDGAAKRAISIRDLLTMSSALDCNDSDPESPGNEENMYPRAEWARWAADLPTDENAAGTWRYCTAGTVLLGRIIQNATGESVDHYIERRILEPLGILRRKWFFSESGEAMTGGGLELRSRDLAKLAMLVLQDGEWAGKEIVPAAFIDDALTVHKNANQEQDYGYLFWRRDYHTACGDAEGWYMAGNGGNVVVMFRELNAAIIVTRTRYNTRGMHQETTRLIEEYALPAVLCVL
jgi:CubicO group peptidase (beta-lactamase class C family)